MKIETIIAWKIIVVPIVKGWLDINNLDLINKIIKEIMLGQKFNENIF